VLANVKAEARALGLDDWLVADLYDQLIEASIAYETEAFEQLRG
jgi:isochorismate pyruvate lyase